MSATIVFFLLQGGLGFVGFGLLRALGLADAGGRGILPALGAALLLGTSAVTLALVILLVLGVPFTLLTALVVAIFLAVLGFWCGRRRRQPAPPAPGWWAAGAAIAVTAVGLYVVYGARTFTQLPTVQDDARIWSFKGIALTYYQHLPREIFLNSYTIFSHQVYPLFQPVLEALLNRTVGHLELGLFHTELWVLLIATVCAAAYLLWWRRRRPLAEQSAIAVLALMATTPFVIASIATGYADIIGSVLLGIGALCLGLWLDGGEDGHLWLGAVLLAAAANTKDEDAVGAALVLVALAVAISVRGDRSRLWSWIACSAGCATLVVPWRTWTAIHGLSDSVQPPLPQALSPDFIVDRYSHLRQVATAIVQEVVTNWGWQAPVFLALCTLALASGTARRLAGFYLLSFALLIASLLWLYTTTSTSLAFLIPTSVYRTIDVFMMLTPFASAHILTRLLSTWEPSSLRWPTRVRPG